MRTESGSLEGTYTPSPKPICNNNPCPPPVFSKASTSFGGNTNIPTSLSTKAFRYAQLVSLPFRARGSGTVVFISNNKGYNKCLQPPRNKF